MVIMIIISHMYVGQEEGRAREESEGAGGPQDEGEAGCEMAAKQLAQQLQANEDQGYLRIELCFF